MKKSFNMKFSYTGNEITSSSTLATYPLKTSNKASDVFLSFLNFTEVIHITNTTAESMQAPY